MHIGMDVYYAPMSYLSNGVPTGFDVDLVNQMKERGKISATIELNTWSCVLAGLADGHYDAVAGILLTPERQEYFDFTIPYFTDSYAVFSHSQANIRGEKDLTGKQAVILDQDAAIEEYLIPNSLADGLIITPTYHGALMMVEQGEADYTIAPSSLGRRAVAAYGFTNIRETGRSLYSVEYRFAVMAGRDDLLFLLNDAISEMHGSGGIAEILMGWDFTDGFERNSVPRASPLLLNLVIVFTAGMTGAGLSWLVLRYRGSHNGYRRKHDRLLAVLDALPWAVWWLCPDSAVVHKNQRCTELVPASLCEEQIGGAQGGPAVRRVKNDTEPDRYLRLHHAVVADPVVPSPCAELSAELSVHSAEDYTERQSLRDAMNDLSNHLAARESRLQESMITDETSGLYNRGYIVSRIQQEIMRFERIGSIFSVVILAFPAMSGLTDEDPGLIDIYRQVGVALRHGLRQADVSGRTGDAEFMVVLSSAGMKEASLVAEKICDALAEYVSSQGDSTARMYCAAVEYNGGNLECFLRQTAVALQEEVSA